MQLLRVVAEVGHHNVEAILNMAPSTIITERNRFMRTMNQVGKFMSHHKPLSTIKELLTKNLHLGTSQAKAFLNIKEVLTQPHVFTWYDPSAETTVSADASAYGLGAILLYNNHDQQWKLVTYASRSLTETRYAQIEKKDLLQPGLLTFHYIHILLVSISSPKTPPISYILPTFLFIQFPHFSMQKSSRILCSDAYTP